MSEARARFADAYRAREAWLFDASLPLWAGEGVDPAGGFFEQIGQDGRAIEAPRRTRVIARQIYVFAAADRMGWAGDGAALVGHGLAALEHACPGPDGLVVATTAADGTIIDGRYDFYDHAFALFALAQAATLAPHRARALARAQALQDAMEAAFRHPAGGFYENRAGTEPLRANPHMHMLEACVALAGVDPVPDRWRTLCDEIVELALHTFVDPASGALREVFGRDWQALGDDQEQAVEPGHQFEWAWLLSAWNEDRGDAAAAAAARRLAEIGLGRGLAPSGLVLDALGTDLCVRAPTLRAWPQCERLKCHVEWALAAEGADADAWWDEATRALAGWTPFLATPIAGLWFDRLNPSGTPVSKSAPASTLYHLVCALETAQAALAGRRAAAVLGLGGAGRA